MPVSASVPAPSLIKLPALVPSETTPFWVAVLPDETFTLTLPPSVTAWAKVPVPVMANVVPAAIASVPPLPRLASDEMLSVPALTAVPPV